MLKEIDIKKGDLSFGQRIELGLIFNSKLEDFYKFQETFRILYDCKPSCYRIKKYMPIFERVIDGLTYWAEREKKELDYKLTPEQIQAGYGKEEQFGFFTPINSMAKAYGKDPDEVYSWKYSKVFMILVNDLNDYKKNVKLQEIYSKK